MLALPALVFLDLAPQDPPKAGTWKDTIDKAKSEAASRRLPILLFVADKTDVSKQLVANFENPELAVVLKFFVGCFLHPDVSNANIRAAYVPWIGSNASEMYQPPLITFGDWKGNPRQEFRQEAKLLPPAELRALLEKALRAIAPESADQCKLEEVRLSKLPRHVEHIETSLGAAKEALTKETAESFRKELEWTNAIVKLAEPKFGEWKDKEKKDQARKALKELGKKLGALGTFRGRDLEKFQGYLQEAEALLGELKALAGE
jgi:hypothetical protein